jgi:hypothetical protein
MQAGATSRVTFYIFMTANMHSSSRSVPHPDGFERVSAILPISRKEPSEKAESNSFVSPTVVPCPRRLCAQLLLAKERERDEADPCFGVLRPRAHGDKTYSLGTRRDD